MKPFFKRSLALLAGAALVLTASGCAASSPDADADADPASGDVGESRTISHQFGTTEVSGTPERVVALGITDSDTLLALGITPVALRPWNGVDSVGVWAEDELGDAQPEVLSTTDEITVEQVAALSPDLIVDVSDAVDRGRYDLLSKVAPTVVRPKDYPDYGVPWQVSTRLIGEAVGRSDQAERLVEETEAKIEETREKYPQLQGKTGAVVLPNPEGGWWPYTPVDSRGQFMRSLGFELPPALAARDDGSSFYLEVSEERTDLLEADVVVAIIQPGQRALIEDNALFANLDVAKRGDVVLAESAEIGTAMSYGTVLSIPYVLDELAPQIAEKLG